MTKLNQVLAIEKGIKSRVYGDITLLDKAIQKPALFNGLVKTYEKLAEDGEDLPGERQRVQYVASDVLREVARKTTELFDVTARKDWTNTVAMGTVMVGDIELFAAPATYLLFLEKQLTDLRTLVDRMPVLDEAEDWTKDENSGLYKTPDIRTHRTKKVQRPIVLYHATPEHPAQTNLITEDVIAGHWKVVKHSGAMPKPEKAALIEKIDVLIKAVKVAREEANNTDVSTVPAVGQIIFDHLGL